MTETVHDRVSWDVRDAIAYLTLDNADAGNALDLAMAQAVGEVADRVERGAADGSIRVAVLAAAGKTFCVGGDLSEFAKAERREERVAAIADNVHRAIDVLRRSPVPVLSIVHGTVAGGGVGLALGADIVLMAEEAKLRLAYTAAGLSPDCGATWQLTQRLGPARTMDLALTNRTITGREAADWGLISRAVPAAELAGTAEEIVTGLRAGSAPAFAQTKRLVCSADSRSLTDQMAEESATIAGLITGPDAVEGVDAFLAKRPPVYG